MLSDVEHISGLVVAAASSSPQYYFHLLRQGGWLLFWRMVRCTTVELKDWIKWPDPNLPGVSSYRDKRLQTHNSCPSEDPLWHYTRQKPFSNTSPAMQSRASTPWSFWEVRKHTRMRPHWLYIEKQCKHDKNGKRKIKILRGGISRMSTFLYMWLSGIQNWCHSVFIQLSADMQVP